MHKIRFWLGLCPTPVEGAHSAPPDLLVGFQEPTSEGNGGKGRGYRRRKGLLIKAGMEGGEREMREGKGEEGMEGRSKLAFAGKRHQAYRIVGITAETYCMAVQIALKTIITDCSITALSVCNEAINKLQFA